MLSFSLAGVRPFAFPSSLSSTEVAACWYRFSRVLVPWFLFYLLILDSSHVSFTDLQRLAGKCMSMFMAVPGARLFAKEINMAISSASRSSRPLPLTVPLRMKLSIGFSPSPGQASFLGVWSDSTNLSCLLMPLPIAGLAC